MAALRFDQARVIDDPGVAASWWSLHERPLARGADGTVTAGGAPLRLLHLPGFRPDRPHWLSPGGTRVRAVADPLLAELCGSYAARVLDHGWEAIVRQRDVGRRLANGVVFDDRLLRLYGEAIGHGEELGDIFTPEGTDAFMGWAQAPAEAGARFGVTRYLLRVYRDRPDLARAYPDLDGPEGQEFVRWIWVFGRPGGIPDVFLPPPPPDLDVPEAPVVAMNVAGFFTGTLGLGEAARAYVRALEAAEIPVRTTTIDVDLPVQERDRHKDSAYGRLGFADVEEAIDPPFNLVCVNADELPRFAERLGPGFLAGHRTIAVWAWETDVIPERWGTAFDLIDEIWVYSRYVAENLARAAPVPVVPIPPPVTAPETGGAEVDLGIPEGFRFLFMFDLFSTARRKNAAGLIEAFSRAFAPGEGPQLVIKTINGFYRPEAFDALVWAKGDRQDIHIVDRSLSVPEKNALMAGCDCYVSLHRSEGYGLTLAECMALGKPVIGTGFSGNLDFMTPQNSYLVDHTITRVGGDVEIYPPDGTWAEPDLDHAAELIRRVVERPEEAAARGERARRDIAAQLAPEAIGRIIRERLERLVRTGKVAAPSRPLPVPSR